MLMGIDDFRNALAEVAHDFGNNSTISEAELRIRWFEVGVFSGLGYGTERDDYRVELRTPGGGRADVVLGPLDSVPAP